MGLLWNPIGFFLNGDFSSNYSFMAVLSLCYCAQAFSSCSKQGPTVYYSVRASHCGDFTGSRANGLSSCGTLAPLLWACGIFPDLGSNLCLLHWQVNSLPGVLYYFLINLLILFISLYWVFIAAIGLSLVAANGGCSWLWNTASHCMASPVAEHRL